MEERVYENGELVYISLEDMLEEAERLGMEVVDKRPSGGCLWVLNEDEHAESMVRALSRFKYSWNFARNGGKASKHRPAWFIKDEKPSIPDKYFSSFLDFVWFLDPKVAAKISEDLVPDTKPGNVAACQCGSCLHWQQLEPGAEKGRCTRLGAEIAYSFTCGNWEDCGEERQLFFGSEGLAQSRPDADTGRLF